MKNLKDTIIDIGYTLEVIRGSLPVEVDIIQDRHFQHIQNQLWKILTTYSFPEEASKQIGTINKNDKL